MTDGPERARLRTYLTGAKDEASDIAGDNWRFCGNVLKETAIALRQGATKIRDGDGQEGGLSGMMADALLEAFEDSSASMEDKGTRLIGGGDALKDTARVMANAKTAEASMADLQQPPAYTAPTPMPGVPPTPEEIKAEAGKRQAANQEMAAYNAARAQQEAAAAQWTQKLDAVFLGSIPPMKAIHGQPDPTEPPPSVPSSPTGPTVPVTTSPPGTPDPTDPRRPDRGEPTRPDRGEPTWEQNPERPERPERPEPPERPERPERPEPPVEPVDPPNPITTPTHPPHVPGETSTVAGTSQSGVTYNPTAGQAPGGVATSGSTGGMNAAALGAAGAAGGASGMAGGIRAGSAPAPTGSSPARPIGATGRSASAGALSRSASATGSAASRAGAAGSPASRGAAGSSASRAGAASSPASRGAAGSSASARGAGASGARSAGAAGGRAAGSAGGRAAGSTGGRGAAQGSGSGGRGSSGARGAGAGGASGRGSRKGDRDQATDRDSLVYEQDWLGDDDVAPGVLD